MSQFDNSEVMLKYANIVAMKDNIMVKEAWTWRDVVQELGISAVVDVGIAAGLAAAGVGGVLTAPVLIPTLLLGGAISMAIFSFTKQMDNNLADLIDRLGDLDPNDMAKPAVDGWIQELGAFKQRIVIPMMSGNVQERAKITASRIAELENLKTYLEQVQVYWPQVKSNLTDWGFDAGQAEHAINETPKQIAQALMQLKSQVKSEGPKVVKDLVKEKEKKEVKEKAKTQSKPGKGRKRMDSNVSEVVRGLQITINQINRDINAGAGLFKETGIYDKNTADALVGVMSSNPRIMTLMAGEAKVNYDTVRDIKQMRSRPRLIKLIYRTLKSEPMQEIVEEMKRKHVPLSRRDVPERLISRRK